MGAYASELHDACREFAPYLDSYWRDYESDECYAAFVGVVYMSQDGSVVGTSYHCSAPTDEAAALFQDYTLAQTGSLMQVVRPDADSLGEVA